MSYFNKYKWELVPEKLPVVKRNCPKCKGKAIFINTEKFRVNANKNTVDVWLIFKCEKCKSTWNMTIYERVKPKDINRDEYVKFLANDKDLAREYGFSMNIYEKNRLEVILDNIKYKVIKEVIEEKKGNNESIVSISSKFPIDVRMDKFLGENLNLSRSQIKDMINKGLIYNLERKKLMKIKLSGEINIYIKEII